MIIFKNVSALRLPDDFRVGSDVLAEALLGHQIHSPGPLELQTLGFVSPLPGDNGQMVLAETGVSLIRLATETRLLPSSVLRDGIAARVAEYEGKFGRKPNKRIRNECREAALADLLPRALIKRSAVLSYWDPQIRMLLVDSASDREVEAMASQVREALGSFPARPAATESSLALLLSEWLTSGSLPAGFEFGDECELKSPSDPGMVARFRHHDLSAEDVREHARSGMQVTQLALIFEGRASFTLDHRLKLRKFRLLDVVMDQIEAVDGENPDTLASTELVLMAGELRKLLSRLDQIFHFVD